jgi:hypothetical protein
VSDIEDPLLHISGSGAVHGFPDYISSSRGKLQGVTALTVMTTFLSSYSKNKYKLLAVGNNKGIISKCDGRSYTSLRSHRQANIDLFLTQKQAASNLQMKLSWVKSHTDKKPWSTIADLKKQNLSRDEICNVWVDKIANEEWYRYPDPLFDPALQMLKDGRYIQLPYIPQSNGQSRSWYLFDFGV